MEIYINDTPAEDVILNVGGYEVEYTFSGNGEVSKTRKNEHNPEEVFERGSFGPWPAVANYFDEKDAIQKQIQFIEIELDEVEHRLNSHGRFDLPCGGFLTKSDDGYVYNNDDIEKCAHYRTLEDAIRRRDGWV